MLSDRLTTTETARLLGVSISAVHRLHRDGTLTAHKLDGLRGAKLFARADVEALVAERRSPKDAA